MADERARAEALLRAAQASGDAGAVARQTAALRKLHVAVSGKPPEAAAAAAADPETPPPPRPSLIRRLAKAGWDEAKSEAGSVTDYLGLTEPTDDKRRQRLDATDAFVLRGANMFGMGAPNLAVDAMEPRGAQGTARAYRERLYSTPGGQRGGRAGDVAGAIAGAAAGPARAIGGAVRAGVGAVGRALAPRIIGGAQTVTDALASRYGQTGLALAETGAINTAQNAVDPDATSLTQGLELAAPLALLAPWIGGAGSALARRKLLGRPDDPTWIRRYRNAVESGRLELDRPSMLEGTPGYEGGVPHPNDVYNAGAAKNRVPEMRDVRDTAEEAFGQAAEHRAGKARKAYGSAQEELKQYLGVRVDRQALIDDLRAQRVENVDPYLGTVDDSLDKVLGEQQTKLEATRPAPRPVLEGARPPTEQPELRIPATPPIERPTPPMTRPAFSGEQERLPFGQPPIPPEGRRPPQPPLSLPPTEIGDHIAALARSAERDAAGQTDFPFVDMPDHRGATGAQTEMRAPKARTPDLQPPTPLEPPSGRTGEQVEINIPPQPPPIPGHEASGGVGSYQREMQFPEPEPRQLSVEEARGDPTIGGLRRLRQQARQKAGFESREPATPAQQDARAQYFAYDRAIKNAAAKYAPGYLDLERRMGESARGFRREGDLLTKTEGNLQNGGGVDEMPHHGQADELDAIAAEDTADETLKPRARGIERDRIRSGKQQGGATFMQRSGDTNVPGKNSRASREELIRRDPEYRRMFQMVEDAKSLDAVKVGAKALMPLDLSGATGTVAGWSPEIVRQNLRAIGGRLPPVLESIERAAPRIGLGLPALRDPLDALLERRRR